ncbi:MAG: hypothetical protein K8T26_11970 [Lentisphaerae bacterium]|nr:hypothetical protein [Lentisphaerota bacterium]
MSIVRIVLAIWILGALGIWMVFFAYQQWRKAKEAQQLVLHEQTAGAASTATGTAPVPDVASTTASTTPAAADTNAVAPMASSAAAGSDVSSGHAVDAGTAPAAPEVTSTAPQSWPLLKISGVVGKGLRGAATINGHIVTVGEKIDDVEVVSIGEYGAKLEFGGETRFAKVGSTVE